jgi:predicted nucleotidyltransferase
MVDRRDVTMRYIDAQEQEAVETWLEDAVDRLVRQLSPARIILFGSWARETATRHSDIDLCIIWDTEADHLERIGRVMDLLNDGPRPVEPVVYTPAEWDEMRGHVPFARRIANEGTVLYERGETLE